MSQHTSITFGPESPLVPLPQQVNQALLCCTPFLNWRDGRRESGYKKAIVFRSLVATLKIQPALDDSLEDNAVKFLESVVPYSRESADAFLSSLALLSDDYLTNFVQSIVVLLSSASQAIIKSSMKILRNLIFWWSEQVRLALVKADLLPQIITILNPLSLSFADAFDIHTHLLEIVSHSLWLAHPYYLTRLRIDDRDDQQAVRETVFQQVLVPSENYIWHLCVNRFSILDGDQSSEFMTLLAWLTRISPYYQPTIQEQTKTRTNIRHPLSILARLPSLFLPLTARSESNKAFERSNPGGCSLQKKRSIDTLFTNDSATTNRSRPNVAMLGPKVSVSRRSLFELSDKNAIPLCLSLITHALLLPSASPSQRTPSHSPLSLPHHPHPPTPLCLSLATHTLPLPSASPSSPTPSHSPLPLPHHAHPPTPLCLSLTTDTLPLPSASPSPRTPSHSPLPLPRHAHPPTHLCLSLTTHTLPLPSASPSPRTPSHSPLPLPRHAHPPTPLCLSLTTHTLPLHSASPSPPSPSHSPLPLPHHPHPPTPLCLSLTTHALPLHSASPSPPTPSHSTLPLPSPPTPSQSIERAAPI
ncbi:hypothetical protein BLNAU_1090 [Blattamonas nauphoetae]|uniref:Uncharacterized protein n=1 Tax=Blattamonas nauphoetae TaxID=2049346 RepID=A0ABQ9YKA8_9EUKA|nr:hypothetical protein BLNAU_1090 [Blattamonas nauphoetae]